MEQTRTHRRTGKPRLRRTGHPAFAQWIKAGGAVRIERDDTALSTRRTWVCELPNGLTNIPCGGTHLRDLAELSDITTSLTTAEIDGGLELVMETVSAAT